MAVQSTEKGRQYNMSTVGQGWDRYLCVVMQLLVLLLLLLLRDVKGASENHNDTGQLAHV